MIKTQKGNIQFLVIIIVIVGIVIGLYLVQQTTNLLPKAATPGPRPSVVNQPYTIQNDSDLMKASSDLDTNLNIIDSELDKNDSDLSTF